MNTENEVVEEIVIWSVLLLLIAQLLFLGYKMIFDHNVPWTVALSPTWGAVLVTGSISLCYGIIKWFHK